MTFFVTITGLSATDDDPLWSMETAWWGSGDLTDDSHFKDVSWTPGYRDYEAVLAVEEAKALAALCGERIRDLDCKLANRDGQLARVKMTVFEFESGLGC